MPSTRERLLQKPWSAILAPRCTREASTTLYGALEREDMTLQGALAEDARRVRVL